MCAEIVLNYHLDRAKLLVLQGIFEGCSEITLTKEYAQGYKLGNACLFTNFVFTIFVPLKPPPSQPAK